VGERWGADLERSETYIRVDISAYRHYIEAALEYADGSHTFDDIVDAVSAGKMQFWPGPASAVITEVLESPRQRSLNFFLAGGNLAELEAMTPTILEWGRRQGCTKAIFAGRPGWERTFLTRTGWAPAKLVVFERSIA
jgi:hypothetical protein